MNPFLTRDPANKHSTLYLKSNSLTIHLTIAQGYLTITHGVLKKDIAYFATTFDESIPSFLKTRDPSIFGKA